MRTRYYPADSMQYTTLEMALITEPTKEARTVLRALVWGGKRIDGWRGCVGGRCVLERQHCEVRENHYAGGKIGTITLLQVSIR